MFVAVVLTTVLNLIPTLLYGVAIDRYIPNMDAMGLTIVAIGYLARHPRNLCVAVHAELLS